MVARRKNAAVEEARGARGKSVQKKCYLNLPIEEQGQSQEDRGQVCGLERIREGLRLVVDGFG